CGKKIGPDPRNFNQRVSLGRNDLLIRTFPNRETSILSAPQGKSDENAVSENLARSIKEAMSDQSLKLEITMVNEKGDRKTYNVENNGRITTPMNY
ncbi:hypothetical protein L8T69_24655, partial [Enterobacter roggenkampii]|nr:hypothetical protein [Enterobacter roggenkampii]